MPAFMPGLELSEAFYDQAVKPILEQQLPDLIYAAALIGSGSEVLGFDTTRSTDHHWGPRLLLFLPQFDPALTDQIDRLLRDALPHTFRGFSTNFGSPDAIGVRLMQPIEHGPVDHMVEIFALDRFLVSRLGVDPRTDLDPIDWLLMPQQRLLEITAGKVFHDGSGELGVIRRKLAYYPHEIWLYLLAAQWQTIAQEEAFVGRAGDVGDELGSALVAARQVRRLMHLCFLIERRYMPYSKWFGSAWARLDCAPTLTPILERALAARDWKEREAQLAAAYEHVATMYNALRITPPLHVRVRPYYDRPYLVINAGRFVDAIRDAITDPDVQRLPPLIGSGDQWIDSTDVLTDPARLQRLRALYEQR